MYPPDKKQTTTSGYQEILHMIWKKKTPYSIFEFLIEFNRTIISWQYSKIVVSFYIEYYSWQVWIITLCQWHMKKLFIDDQDIITWRQVGAQTCHNFGSYSTVSISKLYKPNYHFSVNFQN